MEPTKVKCLETVADYEGTYNVKGRTYEVLYYDTEENIMDIEVEPGSGVSDLRTKLDDPDFLVLYEEEDNG